VTGEDDIILDQDNRSRSSYLTYDVVMLMQLQEINRLASKELTAGWWEQQIRGDNIVNIYHEDGREAFINAVKMLKQSLVGEENEEVKTELDAYKQAITIYNDRIEKNQLSIQEQEDLILKKLRTYNKIYTILLKIMREKSNNNYIYIERYK
jgi:hypothetical protein